MFTDESFEKKAESPARMSQEDLLEFFNSLKPKEEVLIWYDSGIRRADDWTPMTVGRRSESKKYNLKKVSLTGKHGGKFILYNRQGKISLAMGGMATVLIAAKKNGSFGAETFGADELVCSECGTKEGVKKYDSGYMGFMWTHCDDCRFGPVQDRKMEERERSSRMLIEDREQRNEEDYDPFMAETFDAESKMSKESLMQLRKTYDNYEDRNEHMSNYLLLATFFGTDKDKEEVKKIMARRNRRGHLTQKESTWLYENINPYYDHLRNVKAAETFGAESEKEELERLRRLVANLPDSICRCCGDSKGTGDGINFSCVFCEEMKECDLCNEDGMNAETFGAKGIDTFAKPLEDIGISKPYARLGVIAAGITALAFGVKKLRK